jgi:nucleoid-associated protein YgaU
MVRFSEFRDIEPAQVNTGASVPRVEATAATRTPTAKKAIAATYTVVPGDYLVRIGKKVSKPWREIYDKNKSIIGANPNVIKVGQVFTI